MAENMVLQQSEIALVDLTDHVQGGLFLQLQQEHDRFIYNPINNNVTPSVIEVSQLVYLDNQLLDEDEFIIRWYCNNVLLQESAQQLVVSPYLLVNNECILRAEVEYGAQKTQATAVIVMEEQVNTYALQLVPQTVSLSPTEQQTIQCLVYQEQSDVTYKASSFKWYKNGVELPENEDKTSLTVTWDDVNTTISVIAVVDEQYVVGEQFVVSAGESLMALMQSSNGYNFADEPINTTLSVRVYSHQQDVTHLSTFTWYRNDEQIGGQSQQQYTVQDDTAPSVKYKCVVQYGEEQTEQTITLASVFSTQNLMCETSTVNITYTSTDTFSPQTFDITPRLVSGNSILSQQVEIYDDDGNMIGTVQSGETITVSCADIISPSKIPMYKTTFNLRLRAEYNSITYTCVHSLNIVNERYSWLKDWNNGTLIGDNYIQTGKLFTGVKDASEKLTGVLIGNFGNFQIENADIHSGITQLQANNKVFEVASFSETQNVSFFVGNADQSYIKFDTDTGIVEIKGIIKTLGGQTLEEQMAEIEQMATYFLNLNYVRVDRYVTQFIYSDEQPIFERTFENSKEDPIQGGILLVFGTTVMGSSLTITWNGVEVTDIDVGTNVVRINSVTYEPGDNTLQVIAPINTILTGVMAYQSTYLVPVSETEDPSVPGVYISDQQFMISNGIRWVTYLSADGSGYLAHENISWDQSGNLTITANTNIIGGSLDSIMTVNGKLVINSAEHTISFGKDVHDGYDGIYIDEQNYILPGLGFQLGTSENNWIRINENALEINSDYMQLNTGSAQGIIIRNGKLQLVSPDQTKSFLSNDNLASVTVQDLDAVQTVPGNSAEYAIGEKYPTPDTFTVYEGNPQEWQVGTSVTINKLTNEPALFAKLAFMCNFDNAKISNELLLSDPSVLSVTVMTEEFVETPTGLIIKGTVKDQTDRVLYSGVLWITYSNTQSVQVQQTHYHAVPVQQEDREYGVTRLSNEAKPMFAVSDAQYRAVVQVDSAGDLVAQKDIYAHKMPIYLPRQQKYYFKDDLVDMINGIAVNGYYYEHNGNISIVK